MADISKSCDWPKKENFESLHKHFKNDYGIEFPKGEIFDSLCNYLQNASGGDLPKRKFFFKTYLMAYLTRSQMPSTKITKNGNYQKWKLPKMEITKNENY